MGLYLTYESSFVSETAKITRKNGPVSDIRYVARTSDEAENSGRFKRGGSKEVLEGRRYVE